MEATRFNDASTTPQDATVRLRVEIYDALAASKGHPSVASQARWHGVGRSTLFLLRAGGQPRLHTAMRMAADCGVPVETIWERVA